MQLRCVITLGIDVNADPRRARSYFGRKYVSAHAYFLSLVLKMAAGVSKMERWPATALFFASVGIIHQISGPSTLFISVLLYE